MTRRLAFIALSLAGVSLLAVAGCGTKGPDAPPAPAAEEDKHGHKPGAHGGIIVEIGRDSYHAEAVFEKGGRVRLYTLGKDEARVQEVEKQTLTAFAKAEGGQEATRFTLEPEPQPGDAEGKTSQFVGTLPNELWGKGVEVTVPNLVIAGERFRLAFQSTAGGHEEDPMLPKVAGDEEKKLYLTPGGKYTAEDIEANGRMTASQKFQGVKAAHDRRPKSGDKICPVTMTKANPNFSWVVGGKTYEFCCPPCVDEFVKLAKEKPDEVADPDAYVKGN